MEENSEIIIDRNDNEWDISPESSIVYNLKSISKLAKEKLEHILPVVKKMILSSTFIFNWKMINSIQFILEVHIILLISSITAMAINKELTSDAANILRFLNKFFILNTITLPLWIGVYYLIIIPSNKVHHALFSMSSFILDKETLTNESVSYKLKEDFSIKITHKPSNDNDNKHKETLSSLHNYSILSESLVNYAVNICLFFEDSINSYNKLLDKEDLSIINQLLYYRQKITEKSIHSIIGKYITPLVIAASSCYFCAMNKEPSNSLIIMLLIVLLILWLIIYQKEREIVRKLDAYIDARNDELIPKGKFIFRLHSLLSVFSLTYDGCIADRREIREFIMRICAYKSIL